MSKITAVWGVSHGMQRGLRSPSSQPLGAHEHCQLFSYVLHFLCRPTSSISSCHGNATLCRETESKFLEGDYDWPSVGQVDTPTPVSSGHGEGSCGTALVAAMITIVTLGRRDNFQKKGEVLSRYKRFLSIKVFPISCPTVRADHHEVQGLAPRWTTLLTALLS